MDTLPIFLDACVYCDAFQEWGADGGPVIIREDDTGEEIIDNPASAILRAVHRQSVIGGRRLILHSSERVVGYVVAALIESYGFDRRAAMQAGDLIEILVEQSDGCVVEDEDVAGQRVPRWPDQEDAHRYVEAKWIGAQIVVTRDGEFIRQGDRASVPLIMHPRDFLVTWRTRS